MIQSRFKKTKNSGFVCLGNARRIIFFFFHYFFSHVFFLYGCLRETENKSLSVCVCVSFVCVCVCKSDTQLTLPSPLFPSRQLYLSKNHFSPLSSNYVTNNYISLAFRHTARSFIRLPPLFQVFMSGIVEVFFLIFYINSSSLSFLVLIFHSFSFDFCGWHRWFIPHTTPNPLIFATTTTVETTMGDSSSSSRHRHKTSD